MDKYLPYATIVITIAILLYNIINTSAIRGNELKHIRESLQDVKDSLCHKIDEVKERVERLEDRFLK